MVPTAKIIRGRQTNIQSMLLKKWLLGSLVGMFMLPAYGEPNEMTKYYQSLIEVGYYYADISISQPTCLTTCPLKLQGKKNSLVPDNGSNAANQGNNSQQNSNSPSTNTNNTTNNSNDNSPKAGASSNNNKTNTPNLNTPNSNSSNVNQSEKNSYNSSPSNSKNTSSVTNANNQDLITIRNVNKPNELSTSNENTAISSDDFHFIVYKEWQVNKSNIFIKQMTHLYNNDITIMRAFYLLANGNFSYKQAYNNPYPLNENFAQKFPFYSVAYIDFMYYFYDFKKIKENDNDIFFSATLKKSGLTEGYPSFLSPSIRIKFNKQYNLPVKFIFFNKMNKTIGEINVSEVDKIGKQFYAVAYNIVNNEHEQSMVNVDNILIGLSLELESDSKLRLDEYKDLTQEIIIYEGD